MNRITNVFPRLYQSGQITHSIKVQLTYIIALYTISMEISMIFDKLMIIYNNKHSQSQGPLQHLHNFIN